MSERKLDNSFPKLDVKLLLFFAYLILIPIYAFPSGGPQPSDYLMIILMLLVFFDKKHTLDKKFIQIYAPLLVFVYYVTLLNTMWVGITGEIQFFRASLFYIYNCLVFILMLKMYTLYGVALFPIILFGLAISVLIELAILLMNYGLFYRSIGSFNNPNQLGYYSVVSVSVFSIIIKEYKIGLLFEVAIILFFLFVVVLSLSKAALLAVLFNILFVFFKHFKYALLLSAFFVLSYFITDSSNPIVSKLDSRLSTFGTQHDDNLIGRAYDRIWENPEYLLLGAGEGLTERFTHGGINKEIHSSLGSILFSYGILGFILFLVFLYLIYKNSKKEYLIFIIPSFIYGTTHQGLRFTFFWILLSVLVIMSAKRQYSHGWGFRKKNERKTIV